MCSFAHLLAAGGGGTEGSEAVGLHTCEKAIINRLCVQWLVNTVGLEVNRVRKHVAFRVEHRWMDTPGLAWVERLGLLRAGRAG